MNRHDAIQKYISSQEFTNLAPRTQTGYMNNLSRKFPMEALIKDMRVPVAQFECEKVMTDSGLTSAHHYKRVMSTFWEYCIRQGWADINPWKSVKLPSKPPRQVVWEKTHIDKVWKTCRTYKSVLSPQERLVALAMIFAYETAQRVSDVINLQEGDIDWDTRALSYTQSKRGKGVWVPLTERAWKAVNLANDMDSPGLFGMLEDNQASKAFSRVRTKLGLPKELQFRDARRTRVTQMMDSGVTDAEACSWSGHQNVASLKPYKAILDRGENDAAKNVLAKLKGKL